MEQQVHNKLPNKIGISETPSCLFCKTETETIEHIYIECDIVKNLWKVTEDLVRMIYDAHFKISDIEKIFGENNKSTQTINHFQCQRCNIFEEKNRKKNDSD